MRFSIRRMTRGRAITPRVKLQARPAPSQLTCSTSYIPLRYINAAGLSASTAPLYSAPSITRRTILRINPVRVRHRILTVVAPKFLIERG